MNLKIVGMCVVLMLLGGCASDTAAIPASDTKLETAGWFREAASGRTLYVSENGDDSNDGLSELSSFATLQKAANEVLPGDTVLVMDGTYSKPGPNTHVLDIQKGGTPDNYIIFKAAPGHSPRVKVDNNYTGIRITTSYVVIEGFIVEGNNANLSFEEADSLARGTDFDAALRNTLYTSSGISSYPESGREPHHLIIRKNTVYGLPGGGILSNGSDYVRIEQNVVYENAYYSPNAGSGISFYRSKAIDDKTDTKMWIRNNIVYKNENKVPRWYSSSDPAQRFISDGNGIIIDDSLGEAGETPYNGTFLIQNNLVYDNGGRGINIFESANVIARYNTLYHNGRTTDENENDKSELGIGRSNNIEFYSNIFGVRDDREPLLFYSSEDITFSKNLFNGGNTDLGVTIDPDNIVGVDPGFVSPSVVPSEANFRLQSSSPAVDAGSTTAPNYDLEGTPRPKGVTFDIGAYESH